MFCVLINRFNKIFIITAVSLFLVSSLGSEAFGYGAPPPQSSANNYTVEIYSDKESYNLGETVTFSGNVNKYDEDRNLRISIFDSSNKFIITQKTPVNIDGTFSHSVILNEKFSDGDYIVRAQYGSSKITVEKMSFVINSDGTSMEQKLPSAKVPDWIKFTSGVWVDGQSSDGEFISAIQFLIADKIIVLPPTAQGSGAVSNEIPSWIKFTTGVWVDGQSSDGEFIGAIQFLIKEGIMKISN